MRSVRLVDGKLIASPVRRKPRKARRKAGRVGVRPVSEVGKPMTKAEWRAFRDEERRKMQAWGDMGAVGRLVARHGVRRKRGAVRLRNGNLTAIEPIPAKTAQYLHEIHRTIGGVGQPVYAGAVAPDIGPQKVTMQPLAGVFRKRDDAVTARDWLRARKWAATIYAQPLQAARPDRYTRQARAGRQYGYSIHNVMVSITPNDRQRFEADMNQLYIERPDLERARVDGVGDLVPTQAGEPYDYCMTFFRKLQANLKLAGVNDAAMAPLPATFIITIGEQVVWLDTDTDSLQSWLRLRGLTPEQAVKITAGASYEPANRIHIEGPHCSLILSPAKVISARVEAGERGLRFLSINIRES